MTRRNNELLLLCVAAPLVILLFAMVALNQDGGVTLDNLTVPLGMFATFVVAHLQVPTLPYYLYHLLFQVLALPLLPVSLPTWLFVKWAGFSWALSL